MELEIGSQVTILNNSIYNEKEVNTQNTRGLIINKEVITTSGDTTDTLTKVYSYQTQLAEPIYTYSDGIEIVDGDGNPLPQTYFYYNDTDLVVDPAAPIIDTDDVSTKYQTAYGVVSDSARAVSEMRDSVDLNSPYHDILSSHAAIMDAQLLHMAGLTIEEVERSPETSGVTTSRKVERDSETMSVNGLLFTEISANLLGFYSIVSEVETELKIQQEQSMEERRRADEDDVLNYKAYHDSFINNPLTSNILIPGNYHVQDPSILETDPTIDPSSLITEALQLEED